MKLNSRLYKQKCSVGVAKSAITRANVIALIELVADADEEASPTAGGQAAYMLGLCRMCL